MPDDARKDGWARVTFGEMAHHVAERVEPTPDDAETYIGLEHLDSGSLTVRRWGADIALIGTKLRMRKGDLLFARRNAYLRRVALAPHDGLFSAHGMVLRARADVVLPEFLPFLMQSDAFMDRAEQISVGSLSPTINWGTLKDQTFALPPLEEQRRISQVLCAAENHGQALTRLSNAAATLLQSTVDDAFLGRICDSSLSAPRSTTSIGELPSAWTVRPLAEVCSKIVDGVHKRPDYVAVGVPFLTIENLNGGPSIDFSATRFVTREDHAEFCKRTRPERGDVLVSKDGTLGVARVVETDREFSLFVSIALLKPAPARLDSWFLRYYFDSTLFKRRLAAKFSGSALKHIHLVDFRESLIPVPSLCEQQAIVATIRAVDQSYQRCLSEENVAKRLREACRATLLSQVAG